MVPILRKISSTRKNGKAHGWTGPLAPITDWTSPITDPDNQLEQLTPDGAAKAKKVGAHLLRRYPRLVPTCHTVYADKKSRTQDTAKAFVQAFPHGQNVSIVQIKSKEEHHSIIPHKSCPAFTKAAGDDERAAFAKYYTQATISRLAPHAPVELNATDIVGLQQWCGYESAITGNVSSLCNIFSRLEWLQYEYLYDIKYTFMVGHGNKLSPYLGFPWLNRTASLFAALDNSDDPQRFFVAFTHREVPPMIATALGLFNSSSSAAEEFPTDRVNFARAWRMAELIPFLGHLGLEKMVCDASSGVLESQGREFVRVVANGAPRPIPQCQDGPGASCGLAHFGAIVAKGMDDYGDFDGVCKTESPVVWST